VRHLVAVYFWVMGFCLTVVFGSAVIIHGSIHRLLRPHVPFDPIGHKYGISWGKLIMTLTPGWSLEVTGTHNLGSKPVVYVANHSSMVDIWVMFTLGVDFRWLSKDEYFRIPLLGTAMRMCGYIPVLRTSKSSQKQAMEQSYETLKRGHSMFFFPEGTRSKTAELLEFKLGAFKLAKEAHVPIQPIVLYGANQLLEKGGLIPQKAKIQVSVLPPQSLEDVNDLPTFAANMRRSIQERLNQNRSGLI
jgi:1-acyl-sn-glycerol-3-phosphate acyltransferase